MQLKCDEPLLNVACSFNLRHYDAGVVPLRRDAATAAATALAADDNGGGDHVAAAAAAAAEVGWCRLTPAGPKIDPRLTPG